MDSTPSWPYSKRFAFTVFDDTDSQTRDNGKAVYDFLTDCGFRTTKSVWPVKGPLKPSDRGQTCADPRYRTWAQGLQTRGFEIGYHMATSHTSERRETIAALDKFGHFFGGPPKTMANHYYCKENLYWGDERVSGMNRLAYNLLTGFRNHRSSFGHVQGHPCFWGDICRERIKYVRNFVFADVNTLKVCPMMPYHDPERPYVNYWFCSTEGANVHRFIERLSEREQDRLEEEGGACIMYTHFALGFCQNGTLNRRFRGLMERLAQKDGWFVPVVTLLDFLLEQGKGAMIDASQRAKLERRWLLHKIRFGSQ